jgi:hypothetical protein
MLHHPLPQLISQVALLGRHAVDVSDAATGMVTIVLDSLESPRNAGRAVKGYSVRLIKHFQKHGE